MILSPSSTINTLKRETRLRGRGQETLSSHMQISTSIKADSLPNKLSRLSFDLFSVLSLGLRSCKITIAPSVSRMDRKFESCLLHSWTTHAKPSTLNQYLSSRYLWSGVLYRVFLSLEQCSLHLRVHNTYNTRSSHTRPIIH